MIIVSANHADCAVNVLPFTADAFHRSRQDRERLIIDSPAVADAFTQINGNSWYGKLSLCVDLWNPSNAYARIEGHTYQTLLENHAFSWVYLTDTEIDLVLKSCYPCLKRACNRESYKEALAIEQEKRDCFLMNNLLKMGFSL